MIIYLGTPLPTLSSGVIRAEACEQQSLRNASAPCSRRGLPPAPVTRIGCALLPHSFHPYREPYGRGGIVSVALSLGSPPVAVNNRPALCCPDFPHPRLREGAIIS